MESKNSNRVQNKEYSGSYGRFSIPIPGALTSFLNVYSQYTGPKPKGRKLNRFQHDFSWEKFEQQNWFGNYFSTEYNNQTGEVVSTDNHSGCLGQSPNIYLRWPDRSTEAYNEALDRFYTKYRGDLDVSIDLYQYKQSVKLAKDIANVIKYVRTFNVPKLLRSFREYKARNKPAPRYISVERRGDAIWALDREVAEAVSSRTRSFVANPKAGKQKAIWRDITKQSGSMWLAYSYGLKPTCQTVYDSIVELHRNMEPMMKVIGAAKKTDKYTDRFSEFLDGKTVNVTSLVEYSYRCKFVALFRHSASTVQLLSRFTTLNPLGFIWENTPFSFCVDWLYDVGGYLRNMESALLAGPVFESGYWVNTSLCTSNAGCSGSGRDNTGYYYFSDWVMSAQSHATRKVHTRVVMTSPPFPRAPVFKVDFSSPLKALNAVSLLSTFLGNKR